MIRAFKSFKSFNVFKVSKSIELNRLQHVVQIPTYSNVSSVSSLSIVSIKAIRHQRIIEAAKIIEDQMTLENQINQRIAERKLRIESAVDCIVGVALVIVIVCLCVFNLPSDSIQFESPAPKIVIEMNGIK